MAEQPDPAAAGTPSEATPAAPRPSTSQGHAVATSRASVALMSSIRSTLGQANLYPLYAQLRRLGAAVPTPWGLALTTFDACSDVLRNKAMHALDINWRKEQGERWGSVASAEMGQMLMTLNPPEHTRQRRILGAVFDRATLQQLRPVVQHCTDTLLDSLAEQLRDGPADFTSTVSEELPIATIGHWMDLPPADYPLLRACTHDQAYAQELFPSAAQLAHADDAAHALQDYFTELVRDRRRHPRTDVVSAWLRTWDDHEHDRDAVNETVRRLATFAVLAGVETTSSLLSSAAWLLAEHPDQADWLRGNPHAVDDAVEEVLRYDPPVQMASRYHVAERDTTVAGHPIHQGDVLYAFLGAAHHDPSGNADPDRFDIRRPNRRHLAFGGGAHYCLGAGLARLEAQVFLNSFLLRFPRLRLADRPVWEPRVAFRRMTALPLSDH